MLEALEKWSIELFERLLPHHLEIIFEINYRFLREVHIRFHNEPERVTRMSIIEEHPNKQVRMAIQNTASCGFFSSDRTMQEYLDDIWKRIL